MIYWLNQSELLSFCVINSSLKMECDICHTTEDIVKLKFSEIEYLKKNNSDGDLILQKLCSKHYKIKCRILILNQGKYCCDPKAKHDNKKVESKYKADEQFSDDVLNYTEYLIPKGYGLCYKCKYEITNIINQSKEKQVTVESSEAEESMELCSQASKSSCESSQNSKGLQQRDKIEKLNSALKIYSIDPIKRPADAKSPKIEQLIDCINNELGIRQESNEVIDNIRLALSKVKTNAEKIKLLTLAPSSWSIRKIQDEFDVTYHLALKSKSVQQEKGVYNSPDPVKPKNVVTEDQKKDILEFYSVNSRTLPGKKDIKIIESRKNYEYQRHFTG